MSIDPLSIAIAAGAAISVIILAVGISSAMSDSSQVIESRLDKYASRQTEGKKGKGSDDQTAMVMARIDKRIAKQGFAANMAQDIARANLKLTVSEFILIMIGAAALGTVAGFVFTQNPLVALGAGAAGFFVPRLFLRQRKGARLTAFNNQLGDTITLLANSLRAGYSMLQSMEMVSKELQPPMGEEFARVVREIGLGISQQEALDNLLRRIPSDDMDLVVTAINVQHEVGGNLAKILDTIGHTIRERIRIKGEIQVLTAQGRISMYIIIAIPFLLSGAIFMINPTYMARLFEPGPILCLPACSLFMVFIGYIIIRRIIAIEV